MSAFMKLNMWRLEQKIVLFTYRVIAVACLTTPAFAQNVSATALTTENQQKIELAVWKYAIDTP